jgi:hypothetical protein
MAIWGWRAGYNFKKAVFVDWLVMGVWKVIIKYALSINDIKQLAIPKLMIGLGMSVKKCPN